MALTYDIYVNSGLANSCTYNETGKYIQHLEINNSDDTYYQTGVFGSFGPSSHSVGDTVWIKINDTTQFNGYITRSQEDIQDGKKSIIYQLVGKTYDLWRYVIDPDVTASGMTGYIASSLVSTYCTGIGCSDIPTASGTLIVNEINFGDKIVGDALQELTNIDGYRFYVDNDSVLQYYKPANGAYQFTVTEANIQNMSPIEKADEDIVNDVLVIGGTDYSVITNVNPTGSLFKIFPSGVLVAQSYEVKDTELNAVQFYLNRSTGDDAPGTLTFELWEDSESIPIDDYFTSYLYLDSGGTGHYNMSLETDVGSYLILAGVSSNHRVGPKDGAPGTDSDDHSGHSQQITVKTTGVPYAYCFPCSSKNNHTPLSGIVYLMPTGANQTGDFDNVIASGIALHHNYVEWFEFDGIVGKVISGNTYTLYISRAWDTSGSAVEGTHETRIAGGSDANYYDYYALGDAYRYSMGINGSTDKEGWGSGKYKAGLLVHGEFQSTGQIHTNTTIKAAQYLKVDLYGESLTNYINISGSIDGGSTWKTLTDGSWIDFGSELSDGVIVKYKFEKSGNLSPKIDRAVVSLRDANAGGVPKSGSKVDYSDEISFTESILPYGPSSTGWRTWTSPKLRHGNADSNWDVGCKYWMVFEYPSSQSKWWSYYYASTATYDGKIMYSDDGGQNWYDHVASANIVPSGNMRFKLGWKQGNIRARASNQASINLYGRHFKKITDSTITTQDLADLRAAYEVSGSEVIPYKGQLVINGRADMAPEYKFSANLSNYGISSLWDIRDYTQKIDKNGFTTSITYGKPGFDIAGELAKLAKQVESG